jgi:DNA-binding MarR family transcriptional regulator
MPLDIVRHEAVHVYGNQPATQQSRDAVEALLALNFSIESAVERARRASGLTDNEFHIIRYLMQSETDGRPMGPGDLGVMLEVAGPSVTKVVERLVRAGLLTREPHPTDRRSHHLRATPAAVAMVNDSYAAFHDSLVRAVDALDDDRKADLVRTMEDILASLPTPRSDADS